LLTDPDTSISVALSGRPALTVVGFAYSVSATADAWVTPAQLTELAPTATQMLYRLRHAATAEEVGAGQDAVTAGLPPKAVLGSQSYLTIRLKVTSATGIYIPFLVVFCVLGLVVSILIVANVVSGAVVSGWRSIGVLKAIGFTPNQVMAVYLAMAAVPSVIGCAFGTSPSRKALAERSSCTRARSAGKPTAAPSDERADQG
jgi:putative ABC transport system permease protein